MERVAFVSSNIQYVVLNGNIVYLWFWLIRYGMIFYTIQEVHNI